MKIVTRAIVYYCLINVVKASDFFFGSFPRDFRWGISSSSYASAFVVTANYSEKERLQDDIKGLKELGVSTFKFSLSWDKLARNSFNTLLDEKAVQFYSYMVNELQTNGIEAHITLFEDTIPEKIKMNQGWTNGSSINDACEYAQNMFKTLQNKVKYWSTFSDPVNIARETYGGDKEKVYHAVHNMLLAHSCMFHAFKDEFNQGQIGLDIQGVWFEPAKASEPGIDDTMERVFQFEIGWLTEPLIKFGDYPMVLKQRAGNKLPNFSSNQVSSLKGSVDFLGVKYNGAFLVTKDTSTDNDLGALLTKDPDWKRREEPLTYMYPKGLRKLLNKLNNLFPDVNLYVTDTGVNGYEDGVRDKMRVEWIREHVDEVFKAVTLDGVSSVKGFYLRSLVDGLPGPLGAFSPGGLYIVDNNKKIRTKKASAVLYTQIIKDNGLKPGYNGPGGFPSGPILHENGIYYNDFPPNFAWSAATSAYQIEGGWDEDGKGPSIWDVHANTPGNTFNNGNAKITCDSYHKYMIDINLLKELGTKYYRFSIAWTRLMPDGTIGNINKKGIDYYNRVINALKAEGIEPMVTLYHYDLPLALSDQGGWLNETTTDHFKNYADLCFKEFGDRVKFWITFNEPWIVARLGYGIATHPPGHYSPGDDIYIAAHNLIKAHAKAYRVYKEKHATQGAKIGITLNVAWSEPFDMYNPEDLEASDRATQFFIGWFAHPIYLNGDYPEVMKTYIRDKSLKQGYNVSRLPEFTLEEQVFINGTFDFLGLNFYTSWMVTSDDKTDQRSSYNNDMAVNGSMDPNWLGSGSSWLKVTPFGIRKILNWLKREYNNLPVYVTENGVSDNNATLNDYHRIHFFRTYINEMLKAIMLDGCNVQGYTAWSLMDNFEWNEGFSEKYGLYYVNFSDPLIPRIPKGSAFWFSQLVKDNGYKRGYPAIGGRGTAPDYVGKFYYDTFPEGFEWGIATSAYQDDEDIEKDGGIWMNETGDIATDRFQEYKADVQLLRQLKVNFYRFSISWPRIFPNGAGQFSMNGIQYYNDLIDELIKWNIQPVVTLNPSELPQVLEEKGGWLNGEIVHHFVHYADVCFENFGNRVKMWITIDKPFIVSNMSLGTRKQTPEVDYYIVAHNLLKAHAKVYRLYHQKYLSYGGKLGVALNGDWMEPSDEFSASDWFASETAMEFNLGWFANPIYDNGDYPQIMIEKICTRSLQQGLQDCRLPTFTEQEINDLKGSGDFFGVNLFTAHKCKEHVYTTSEEGFCQDSAIKCVQDLAWKGSGSAWLKVAPFAMRKTLNWIKSHYGDVPVYVTANAFSDTTGELNDTKRVDYHSEYINEMLKALKLDNVNVKGYTAWTLLDTPEWNSDYIEQFGFYHVNFSDPNRTRTPKSSAAFYRHYEEKYQPAIELKPLNLIQSNGFRENESDIFIPKDDEFLFDSFPEGFIWSAATASYQVEGGVNEGGRGQTIWDTYSHIPGKVVNNDTGDVACNSYKLYEKDVELLQGLGVSHYRFSIAWSRIFPIGYGVIPNEEGIKYYNRLIDALLEAGITPMVSLYHWDLPQVLQDYGGWTNETTADHFRAYADTCFREFGDRVKFWVTFNEPWVISYIAHELGQMAPGWVTSGTALYKVARTVILAHAKAFRLYEERYRPLQHGQVGITMNCDMRFPKNPFDPADWNAVERALQFQLGWFTHPIYVNGDYPDVMKEQIDRKSKAQGLNESRLPPFSENEKQMIKGSYDFLGLNTYTSVMVSNVPCNNSNTGFFCDQDMSEEKDPKWLGSGSGWLKVVPFGMRKILKWIKKEYNNVPVYITENGISDNNGSLDDQHRIFYLKHYINNVLQAIKLDGCNVKGYTAWALMDNFEWARGYFEKYGLYHVDFSDPERKRTAKASAIWYRNLISNNGFVERSVR